MKLPKSIEAERAVLGGMLLDSSYFNVVKDKLCTEDFAKKDHRSIYHVMRLLWDEHKSFEAGLVSMRLKPLEKYIFEMANETVSTKNILAYVDIVREKSVQRQLIGVATEIAQSALNPGDKDFKEILDEAEAKVMSIGEDENVMVCPEQVRITQYLRELAEEVASADLDEDYLRHMIVEVNRALGCTLQHFEENHYELEQHD